MSVKGEILEFVLRWADDLLGGSPGRVIRVISQLIMEWLGPQGILAVLLLAALVLGVVYVRRKRRSGHAITWAVVRSDLRMGGDGSAQRADRGSQRNSLRSVASTALVCIVLFMVLVVWEQIQRS